MVGWPAQHSDDGWSEKGLAPARYAGPATRRRRRFTVPVLSSLLVVLLIALVAGDRLAAKIATDQVRSQLVAELIDNGVTAESTDVIVGGFPFLTQVARGRYDLITIDMTGVRLAETTLPSLVVEATGVQADAGDLLAGDARVVADRLLGEALLPWSTLATLVDYARAGLTDVTFSAVDDGLLRVHGTAELVGGFEVPVSATARLVASRTAVRIQIQSVEVAEDVPALLRGAIDRLVRQLSVDVDLPALPFGLALEEVEPRQAGVRLVATAVNVPLTS